MDASRTRVLWLELELELKLEQYCKSSCEFF